MKNKPECEGVELSEAALAAALLQAKDPHAK